jgi:hypothetical protein
MTSPHHPDDLHRRQQELEARERALRLRELEAEINQPPAPPQPPLYETVKHKPAPTKRQQLVTQITRVASFLGIVIGVMVAVRIASILGTVVIVGGVAFVIYKIFVEERTRK